MKDETGYFRGVQASRCAFKWTRPRGGVEDSSSTALRDSTISFYDRPLRNGKDYRFSLVHS